jgi:manganese oxidase
MRFLATVILLTVSASSAAAQLPRLGVNDNRKPAGVIENGVMTLELEIVRGIWHPDADDAPGIAVNTIRVAGQPAAVPAPLIRVPLGTIVRTRVHNTLDESMMVWGLNATHAVADSVRIEPGAVRELTVTANAPGNYLYGAWKNFRLASPDAPNTGPDMMASGAFIVDAPGARADDRVLVMHMLADPQLIPAPHGMTSIIATINGKSWPHTEQFTHNVGDTIVWRVLNASVIPHPMHLHGFYFDVLARGNHAADTIYSPDRIRKAVTERMMFLTSMTMRWVPDRPGNWLFHCHLTAHTQLHAPLGPMKASGPHLHDAKHGMSNLMLGVIVRGTPARDDVARKKHRLVVSHHDSIAGELTPRYSYALNGKRSGNFGGPVIRLQKDQPTAITVVNQTNEHTAVHWHGIELESYHDGVAGFGGHGTRITPLIAPGDSFTARMTPPRAGTFIYHTHVDELRQQRGGLYGALIVDDPKSSDVASERIILLSSRPDTASIAFNGEPSPTITLEAGKTHRLRFVHIMTSRPAMFVQLADANGPTGEWRVVAKDGADLPMHQIRTMPARLPLSNGETYDVLYTPRAPGELTLEARASNGGQFGKMTFVVK